MRPRRWNTHNHPDNAPGLPLHSNTESLSRYEERKARREFDGYRSDRLRQLVGTTALAAVISTSFAVDVASRHISADIEAGKEAVRGSHAEIHEVFRYEGENEAANLHGTFVLTGLGTKNPYGTAEMLHPHRENGDVYAVEYSNEDLDTVDIAKRVIEQAKTSDLKEVSFDGYSVGGPVALDIASYIHQNEPDLHVTSVILNSSPIGEGGLTRSSERGVEVMNEVLSLYPDFLYYEDGRVMVEILNRNERYLSKEKTYFTPRPEIIAKDQFHIGSNLYTVDYDSLKYDIEDVRQKMEDSAVASASLIKSQADFITLADYDKNIRILSSPGVNEVNQTLPLIVYTRSRSPEDDQVVNVEASEKNLVKSLIKHGASHMVLREDVGHANPNERYQEYLNMIDTKINPRIAVRLRLGNVMYAMAESKDKATGSSEADTRPKGLVASEQGEEQPHQGQAVEPADY